MSGSSIREFGIGRKRGGEVGVDRVRVETGERELPRIGLVTEVSGKLGYCLRVPVVGRIRDRGQQFEAVHAAAVFGWPITSAGHADCSRRAGFSGRAGIPGSDCFELDDMLPVIAEVVDVVQLVSWLGQDLVEAHLFLGNSDLAFRHLGRAQITFGLQAVDVWAGGELMQVTVLPPERVLNDRVYFAEEQIGRELQPSPQRRSGSLQLGANLVGDDIRPTRPPGGRHTGRIDLSGGGTIT